MNDPPKHSEPDGTNGPGPGPRPPARRTLPDDPRIATLVAAIRARTPARLLLERCGGSYRTRDQLALREDHAAAVDAVWKSLDPRSDWPAGFSEQWDFVAVSSAAATRQDFLRRPDRGRVLAAESAAAVQATCPPGADLQIVVGDGLSAGAVAAQVPRLLQPLVAAVGERGWSLGRPILVRHCRVGILNAVGAILAPRVAVLLIGERPGLRATDSLSAYMAHRPAEHQTDAHRNLVSNIHAAGTPPERAAERIVALAAEMMRLETSGPAIKETLGTIADVPLPAPSTSGLPVRHHGDALP
jgi:ethanolamine ammonia-lyase small subunit